MAGMRKTSADWDLSDEEVMRRLAEGDGEALRSFADQLQDGLIRRLASDPAPDDMLVETIVLAKRG